MLTAGRASRAWLCRDAPLSASSLSILPPEAFTRDVLGGLPGRGIDFGKVEQTPDNETAKKISPSSFFSGRAAPLLRSHGLFFLEPGGVGWPGPRPGPTHARPTLPRRPPRSARSDHPSPPNGAITFGGFRLCFRNGSVSPPKVRMLFHSGRPLCARTHTCTQARTQPLTHYFYFRYNTRNCVWTGERGNRGRLGVDGVPSRGGWGARRGGGGG